MTSHASPEPEIDPVYGAKRADKRKSRDEDSPQAQAHTRSKRSRYISIAW